LLARTGRCEITSPGACWALRKIPDWLAVTSERTSFR
jgi:hypothetical protein